MSTLPLPRPSAHRDTLAADTGASLADLMARMGHKSARAAMIYQSATARRGRPIADAVSTGITRERDRARNGHKPRGQRRT